MGIGRSALVAACLLKSQGIGVDEAFAMISRARGFSVPDTEEQREWVKGWAALPESRGKGAAGAVSSLSVDSDKSTVVVVGG